MTTINDMPEDWGTPLGNIFDSMINRPRKVKRIIVKDDKNNYSEHKIIDVYTPGEQIISMTERKYASLNAHGLSLRRVEND